MHRRPRLTLTAALVGLAVALSGCSRAVKVVPLEGADEDPVCAQVAAFWPDTVGGQPSRITAADSRTVAAWGDPAIVARCGATPPGPTTDQCLDIEGVDWIAVPIDDGVRFTTYGRDPAIQVLVPQEYATEALVMPAFTAAADVVPQTLGSCT
ncbi:MAG TPA: DUF3515 family protein [Ornithinimicrobium sp.]|uniref:DUF3515 family protein n=1 Tax=Ornithinimicrobium sp. TaxID=1977084 RepID=UPI002B48A027|nr:DUF3515 family protein [Ornithinimicrobium sp.]HKJ12273.1 DUF3515 family protein [Ornithinimicrobium sp.]